MGMLSNQMTRHCMRRLPALACLCMCVSAWPATALEELRPALTTLSQQIARVARGEPDASVSVGAFTGPSFPPTSTGAAIQKILVEEFMRMNLEVKRRAGVEIKGDYRDVEDKSSGVLALRLSVSVIQSRTGRRLQEFGATVKDQDVLAQLLGISKRDLGPGATLKQESDEIKKQIEKPEITLHQSTAAATPASPYAIEILVKQGDRYIPRSLDASDGLAYAKIDRGEVYAVRLINNSPLEAGAELTIDGLNVFAFSAFKTGRFVIKPKSDTIVKGWTINKDVSNEFLVTQYAKSAVAELFASPDRIGSITARFSAVWDPNVGPPPDEMLTKFRDPFGDATGRGKPILTPLQVVQRTQGRSRAIVTVRYQRPSF